MTKRIGLVKEATAYSISSIIGRLFNVLLLPLFTAVMPPDDGAYGMMTNLYGWGCVLTIILSMGLETAFMRVASDEERKPNPAHAYSTAMLFILVLTILFGISFWWLAPRLALWLGYPTHVSEVNLMVGIICGDTLLILPFCYLRYKHQALKYATCKALYAGINAALCFVVLYLCPRLQHHYPDGLLWDFYMPHNELNYVLGCNFVTCMVILYILIDEWKPFGHFHSSWNEIYQFSYVWDKAIFRRMMTYALPIMGAALVDVCIQNLDRILFPWLVPGDEGLRQLGIYGACFRIGMIMALATQVLRDIAEPTLFRLAHSRRAVQTTAALIIKYFLIGSFVILLGTELLMDQIQDYLIANDEYAAGLRIVPILMCSEIMVGIQFYMSFWYKLTDRPSYGTLFALITMLVILVINVIFVPIYGYIACAWAIFIGCLVRLMLTYIVSRFKSQYIFEFTGYRYGLVGLLFYFCMITSPSMQHDEVIFYKFSCLAAYLLMVFFFERKAIVTAYRRMRNRKLRKRGLQPG